MKRYISLTVSLLLFLASVFAFARVKDNAEIKPSFGEDYAILRIFDRDGITDSEISNIRFKAEEMSIADVGENGRLWCDAYSYFTEVTASRSDRNVVSNAVVTAGDFFLFHPLEFKDGWYYTDTDLHPDRVVIDERLAFALYGSNNAEGMPIEINGGIYYVAGVVDTDGRAAKEQQLGDKPLVYIPDYIAKDMFGESPYDSYEIMLQNPVKSHAVNAIASATEGKTVVDVTDRFNVLTVFKLLGDFPTRSYRNEAVEYPYWENADRGTEDVLSVILVLCIITALVFSVILITVIFTRTLPAVKSFIKERKKR